jgi:hypothetical protein
MGLHGFESRRHLASWLYPKLVWAIGAAVARFPDTEEVIWFDPSIAHHR